MKASTALLVAFLVSALARGSTPAYASPSLMPEVVAAKQSGPSLVVVVAPLDARARSQAGALEQAAESAVDISGRFDLIRSVDAWEEAAARTRRSKTAQAEALTKSGQTSLDELDAAKAQTQFTDAMAAAQQGDLSRSFDEFIDAWTMKAAAHAVAGENPQAKSEIEKLLAVSTRPKFSDAFFPQDLIKYSEAIRKQIANARGKLTVRTDPAGARVWVDGTYRGVSPVTVDGLAGGKHFITAALGGYQLTNEDAVLGEELVRLKPADGAAKLTAGVDRVLKDPEGPQRDAAAKDLGVAAKADQVLLVVAKKSTTGERLELTLVRVDAKDGHNYAYRTATAPASEVETLLKSMLVSDEPRNGTDPVQHFAGSSGQGGGGISSTRRAVGFGLLGLGVVSLASGIFFGVQAGTAATQYRNTLQVESMKSADLASRGRTFSIVADISYVVCVISAVLGAGLAFTTIGSGSSSSTKSAPPPPAQREEAVPAPAPTPTTNKTNTQSQKKTDDAAAKKRAADEAAEKKQAEDDAAKKKAADAAAQKKADDDAKKQAEEDAKKSEKERKADEKKRAADEKQRAADEKQRIADEKKAAEQKKADDEKKAADDKQRSADEKKNAEAKKAADEKAAADRAAADDAAAQKRAQDEAKREDARRKEEERKEEERKKAAEQKKPDPKKTEDHDDLRNF